MRPLFRDRLNTFPAECSRFTVASSAEYSVRVRYLAHLPAFLSVTQEDTSSTIRPRYYSRVFKSLAPIIMPTVPMYFNFFYLVNQTSTPICRVNIFRKPFRADHAKVSIAVVRSPRNVYAGAKKMCVHHNFPDLQRLVSSLRLDDSVKVLAGAIGVLKSRGVVLRALEILTFVPAVEFHCDRLAVCVEDSPFDIGRLFEIENLFCQITPPPSESQRLALLEVYVWGQLRSQKKHGHLY